MAELFNIGVSGLRAQQSALNVVGQNITNASTPGYTRQRADIAAQPGASSLLSAGAGARLERIERITDEFVNRQILNDTALHAELESFSAQIRGLEGALFDSDYGIDAGIRDFFAALQNASNEPSDVALREFALASARSLVGRFHGVADRVRAQTQDVTGRLASAAGRVNELAGTLVNLNQRIAELHGERDNGPLNLLLDRRETVLKELATFVSVTTSEQADGQLNVFIGKGQPLVLGATASTLSVDGNADVLLQTGSNQQQQVITEALAGGDLGGLLAYKQEVLVPTLNQLGHLATVLAVSFNDQHKLGIDLNGAFGKDFFRDLNDPNLVTQRVAQLAGQEASSSGRIEVHIDDPRLGTPTNYELRFSASNPGAFTVTRVSDGEVVYSGSSVTPPVSFTFDGLRIELTDGTFTPGSGYLLTPYADYGSAIDVAVDSPTELALAAPVRLSGNPNNQGAAQIELGGVIDDEHPLFAQAQDAESLAELVPPLLVRFVTGEQYRILDNSNPNDPQPLDPDPGLLTYAAGVKNHVLPFAPGSAIVSSSGPNVAKLPAAATVTTSLVSGTNGYPPGQVSLTTTHQDGSQSTALLPFAANSSARDIAEQLNMSAGVVASARTELEITEFSFQGGGTPVELAVNGVTLTGFTTLNELADQINDNVELQALGVVGRSDGATLAIESQFGDDLTLHFQGDPNENVTVSDGTTQTTLNGSVAGTFDSITIGGHISSVLGPGVELAADFEGVFASQPVHLRADFGLDLVMSGRAAAGDEFAIAFNVDGTADNRNALALGDLVDARLAGDPPQSYTEQYASLVQAVGVHASEASANAEAAHILLSQAEDFRESISGVNLDEEAANLIRFEQAYNASAQVISVARDIFNVLLNSVS